MTSLADPAPNPASASGPAAASETASAEVDALIAAVAAADSAISLLLATQALAAAVHPAAIASLVEVLGFNNPGAAVAAVDGLIALGPEAVAPLLGSLDERNYGARAWAVRALAGIGDVRGLDLLEEALASDIGPSVRRAAARGLGQLRLETLEEQHRLAVQGRCLQALVAGCSDGEWVVRYAVAVGLEALGLSDPTSGRLLPTSRQALLGLSQAEAEEVPVVRLRAALALRRLEDQPGS
jgi:phycocyanobilin lyase beta subunit